MISRAQNDSIAALEVLCGSYRRPLLVWCLRRGEPVSSAEDQVQGFLAHLLHSRGLEGVVRDKGRFRTFLLTSFQRYLCDQYRRAHAVKRGGGVRIRSLDEGQDAARFCSGLSDPAVTPDQAYDRAWAETVLDNALRSLHGECAMSGNEILAHRLEESIFGDETSMSYQQIATEFDMTEGAVKTAAYRLRRRLSALVREEVRKTLSDESAWPEELAYLRGLFSRGGRGV